MPTKEQLVLIAKARAKKAAQAPDQEGSMSDVFGMAGESLGAMVPEGAPRAAVQGLSGGLASTVEGIRQLWNKATGDEEELATLNRETEQRKNRLKELTADSPTAATDGEVTSYALPMMAGAKVASAAGKVPQAGTTLGNTLRAMAGGAAGGAASGATQALTPEEEANRGELTKSSAMWGAAGGGIGAPVSALASKIRSAGRKLDPVAAIEDFVARTTGATRASDTGAASTKVSEATRKAKERLEKGYGKQYSKIELDTSLPAVPMDVTQYNITDEVLSEALGSSGAGKRVRDALSKGTASVVLGPGGNPYPANLTFRDVRQAIRDLKDIEMSTSDRARRRSIRAGREQLEADLNAWAAGDKKAGEALSAARAVDDKWRDKVGPMRNKGTPVGDYTRKGARESDLLSGFLGPNKGDAVEELLGRVPKTRAPLRERYGIELLRNPKRAGAAESTAEALLSPQEREYLALAGRKLADRDPVKGVLSKYLRVGNLPRYGDNTPDLVSRNFLADALKGYVGSRLLTEE
jgi:hypothetical protein